MQIGSIIRSVVEWARTAQQSDLEKAGTVELWVLTALKGLALLGAYLLKPRVTLFQSITTEAGASAAHSLQWWLCLVLLSSMTGAAYLVIRWSKGFPSELWRRMQANQL